ncbi:MAG: hypothetical protein EKK37_01860 [Sphingobacteriales bacterium]|nr:MAG: hypothetical protein EKK37_01860 [Sphingobacteriales bacterium]
MKIVKLYLVIVFLSFHFNAKTQNEVLSKIPVSGKNIQSFIPAKYDTMQVERGDLNKDGKEDVVLALKHADEDTFEMDEEPPRLLIVLLKTNDGYVIGGKSDKILMCVHCGGVFGDPFANISITKNVLEISHYGGSNWRWSNSKKFRHQNSAMVLIGSTEDSFWTLSDCNGKGVGTYGRSYKDINYQTGEQEIIEYDKCKLKKHLKIKKTKEPLIKLEEFEYE